MFQHETVDHTVDHTTDHRADHTRRTRRPARTTARGLALTGAAALALTLAGCGDEPAPTTQATVTVTETPSATSTPAAAATTEAPTDPTPSTTPAGGTDTDTSKAGTGALPSGAAPYADGLVIAWGTGTRAEALRYATPEVVNILFGAHSPGGDHWDQVGTEGAAGTIYVTYQDTETGEKLALGVLNEAASKGTEHSVTRAQFPG